MAGGVTSQDRKARCITKPSDGPRSSLWYWAKHAGFLRTSGRYAVIVVGRVMPSFRVKSWLYRTLLRAKVDRHAAVGLEVTFDIFYPHLITIEEDAVVGYNTTILCHEYSADWYRVGPVVIKRRATIGANTTLLPGVIVGEGATVSAMSLVNRDIPPGEMWGGVPVRLIRQAGEKDAEGAA